MDQFIKRTILPYISEAPEKLQYISKERFKWWMGLSKENQSAHLKEHPDGDIAKLVKAGKLKFKGAEQPEQSSNMRKPVAKLPNEQQPDEPSPEEKEAAKEERLKKTRAINHPGERVVVKDKTLKKTDTVKSPYWRAPSKVSNEEWYDKHKDSLFEDRYTNPTWVKFNQKIPVKYFDFIERAMNSKYNSGMKISSFISGGTGAGTIKSQSGEILTLMASTMNDDDWKQYKSHLLKTARNRNNPIITPDWIDAADDNRKAIFKRLQREFKGIDIPNDIVAGAWDVKEEVEDGLGMNDYKKNKGFSTDMYLKIRHKGEDRLFEQSLKKSANVNLTNSSTKKFKSWDKDTPDELLPEVYGKKQAEKLSSYMKEHSVKIEKFLKDFKYLDPDNKTYKEIMKDSDGDINNLMSASDRSSRRAINNIIKLLSERNDESAKSLLNDLYDDERTYRKNACHAIMNNLKLKTGMLNDIRENLPLRSVAEGEEGIAIGDLSLDKFTMKEMFGTNNWDSIKDHMDVKTVGKETYLIYSGENKDKEDIKIASVGIREDGIGFSGGTIKFELKLHPHFVKKLKEADESVLMDSVDYIIKKLSQKYLF